MSRLSEAERKRGDKLEFKLKQKEVIINELMTPVKDATDIEMLKQLELEVKLAIGICASVTASCNKSFKRDRELLLVT